jgi:uncharacterized lipoprotein YddW (UPF0748 family)
MEMPKLYYLLALFTGIFYQAVAQTDTARTNASDFKREFRGVWVATVKNVDWPAKPGETSDQQKQELTDLLNYNQQLGMNAVILQVRPAADAFYAQGTEPWSQWLTGLQGQAPNPYYDPLEFAITEAHKRGMELHAWFNPYRATVDTASSKLSPQHITKIHPEWFFTYGGQQLFNPALPQVREYIVKVILNVMAHYDIDGIHMDDYFYPYPVKGEVIHDEAAFKQYGAGFSNVDDWRRNNVDLLIKMLADSIHKHNPRMKFGISPFSVWANKSQNPEGSETKGLSSNYALYADSRKWAREGWVDYIAPQLYRPLCDKLIAFDTMVNWWSSNVNNRHLYIGQAPFQAVEGRMPAFRDANEIPREIKYLRDNYRVQGSIYFSAASLKKNPLGLADSLKQHFYKLPALPPPMLWLDSVAPHAPQLLKAFLTSAKTITLTWQTPVMAADNEPVYGYVLYRFGEREEVNINDPSHILHIQYDTNTTYDDATAEKGKKYIYVVTAIDRLKNESGHSEPAAIRIP